MVNVDESEVVKKELDSEYFLLVPYSLIFILAILALTSRFWVVKPFTMV
jgi:hypothetical protein